MSQTPQPLTPGTNLNKNRNARNELAKALDTGNTNYFYPNDIEDIEHWMCFRVNSPKALRDKDFEVKNDLVRIFLPIPANLATGYSHGYNAESLGPIGAKAVEAGAAFREGGMSGGISSLKDKLKSVADTKQLGGLAAYYGSQALESGGGALVGALGKIPGVGSIATAAAGLALAPATKGAMVGAGVSRNPYMALVYSNPEFRQHQFSWKFISRNYKESEKLLEIIQLFKYHAAPSRTGDTGGLPHFFNYPEQFDIDFHHDEFLFNIAPSVLTSISVNYHAENRPMYHSIETEGGKIQKVPVAVQFSTTFQEVAVITKENIREDYR